MEAIEINNRELSESLSEIAKRENRTISNMAETVLLDFVRDYNGN